MFHRPKRVVAFGMSTAGRVVHVAPRAEAMEPHDMGVYVHTDHYDEAVELLARIERLCDEKAALVAVHSIEDEIKNFKKELETDNGFPKR